MCPSVVKSVPSVGRFSFHDNRVQKVSHESKAPETEEEAAAARMTTSDVELHFLLLFVPLYITLRRTEFSTCSSLITASILMDLYHEQLNVCMHEQSAVKERRLLFPRSFVLMNVSISFHELSISCVGLSILESVLSLKS